MKLLNNKFSPFILSIILVFIFFWQFFFKGLLPIPADTIVGLYHPFRDLYSKDYPNGIPYKNFLITDPVRQQYPWKKLVIEAEKRGQLPLWNPYEMAGKPLLANFQSGAFYPLNIIFFIVPFNLAWSLFIFLQPLTGFIFMFVFLRNLKITALASFFAGFVLAFSGFSIAWLEWGNILHTALWLPLILLSIDKINKNENVLKWSVVSTISLILSFLAGHLQTFFYLFIFSFSYAAFRWLNNISLKKVPLFIGSMLVFLAATSFQAFPTLKFIMESARSLDQTWMNEGWFIPWQNIVQFVAPDFFGNPATLNYWGVWNYAEFLGYVGIFPLIAALFVLFFKRDKTILFFGVAFFLSLIFAFPTFIAKIPYILNLPFISTAQPTRLLFLTDFSLAVLAAFGLDYLTKVKKEIFYPLGFIGVVLGFLWISVLNSNDPNFLVSKQNLILSSVIFVSVTFLIILKTKKNNFSKFVVYSLIAITIFDLFRFGWKFTPFTDEKYLFPTTKILSFLANEKEPFRIMSTDSRILAPNFSSVYKIQSIEGYDPLFLERFGEFIAASERGEPNIKPPFGFNRIITPHNFESKLIDLFGIKYILSLNNLSSPNLMQVLQEGETRLYENKNSLPRAFFVERTISVNNKAESIEKMFNIKDLNNIAVVEGFKSFVWMRGPVEIVEYKENKISLKTENKGVGFLVVTDSFYPGWKAKVDRKEVKIYRTDYNFRGIVVPKGKHLIEFNISLF